MNNKKILKRVLILAVLIILASLIGTKAYAANPYIDGHAYVDKGYRTTATEAMPENYSKTLEQIEEEAKEAEEAKKEAEEAAAEAAEEGTDTDTDSDADAEAEDEPTPVSGNPFDTSSSISGLSPLKGARIELVNGDTGKVVSYKITDDTGHYRFDFDTDVRTAGSNYYLRFVSGDIDGTIQPSDGDESYLRELQHNGLSARDVLKYNGHDYILTQIPDGRFVNVTAEKIIRAQKAATQVFLVIDNSGSTATVVDEEHGWNELQVELMATYEMVDQILSENPNVYFGIVVFSNGAYVKLSLTNQKDVILEALNELWMGGPQGGTDVAAGVDLSYNSFGNNDKDTSNRMMVLLTDGFSNDMGPVPDSLRRVKDEEGVNLYSLIIDQGVPESAEIYNQYYAEPFSNKSKLAKDASELANYIKNDVSDFIRSNTVEQTTYMESSPITGCEDADRRAEIDNYFSNRFVYGRYNNSTSTIGSGESVNNTDETKDAITSMFRQADNISSEDNYNSTDAHHLSDKTKFWGETNYHYVLNHEGIVSKSDLPADSSLVSVDADEGTVGIYGYINQDFCIAQRPAFDIDIAYLTATNLKITLSDGTVLQEPEPIEAGKSGILMQNMDLDISQGATIEIEYAIGIKNNSDIQCNHLELVNYAPTEMMSEDYHKLITEPDKTNRDYGWTQSDVKELYKAGYISDESYEKYKGRSAMICTLDNGGKGNDGWYLLPSKESDEPYQIKFVVSRVVSSEQSISLEDFDDVEVIAYTDNQNRRMANTIDHNMDSSIETGLTKLVGVYPGSGYGESYDIIGFGSDYTPCTDLVQVVPPTGLSKEVERRNKFSTIALIVLVIIAIVLIITKIVISRKNEKVKKGKKKSKSSSNDKE